MEDGRKAVWSIPYISVAFFPSLKQNFIAYHSSKVSDCIFEVHQLWQSGFSRVYSNCCCSCSFERKIIKVGQSSHKMYSNNVLNIPESMTILNAHTKNVWKLIVFTSYLSFHFISVLPSGQPERQSPLFSRFSLFIYLFFWLSLILVVWTRIGDPFVSQNPRGICASHSPGRFLDCAYTIYLYSQI